MVSALGDVGVFWCSLTCVWKRAEKLPRQPWDKPGRVRWAPRHRSAYQTTREMIGYKDWRPTDPSYRQICDAHAEHCGALPAVDDGAEIPF